MVTSKRDITLTKRINCDKLNFNLRRCNMKVRITLLTVIMASFIFITLNIAFSQDETPVQTMEPTENKSEVVQGGAVPAEAVNQEPEIQWVWGEVVTVDLQNKTVFVKYLDYESDQEKEMGVAADDKTTFENVASVDELKPKDTVSIDYVSVEGKNIAKNISVEKLETQQAPPTETKQQDLTAPVQAPVEQQPEPAAPSEN
jgi:hypothetical protein